MKKNVSSSEISSSKAGKFIRAIMLCKGITITQLAKKLGITHSYLSLLIHDKKKNPYYRKKILEELNLPPTFWENPSQVDFNCIVKNSQDTNVTSKEIFLDERSHPDERKKENENAEK